jgi:hypothetical protein
MARGPSGRRQVFGGPSMLKDRTPDRPGESRDGAIEARRRHRLINHLVN